MRQKSRTAIAPRRHTRSVALGREKRELTGGVVVPSIDGRGLRTVR